MTYTPHIDLDAVSAIDMHVHVEQDRHGHLSLDGELMDASAAYFRAVENRTPTVADLAQTYREAGMAAVVFTVDARTNSFGKYFGDHPERSMKTFALWVTIESASSCHGTEGWARMTVIPGKSAATSSRSNGLE